MTPLRALRRIAPLAAVLLAGCAAVSSFQTGKVLPRGKMNVGAGLGGGKIDTKTDIAGFDAELPSAALDLWLRAGFLGTMDGGVKLTFPGYVMAEARRALVQESRGAPLSAALGLGYGFSSMGIKASSTRGAYEDVVRLHDLIATLYLSRDLTQRLAVYASPRYVRRRTANRRSGIGRPDEKETFHDDMAGGGVGLRLAAGGGASLMLEYDRLQDTDEDDHRQTFFGLGFDIQFGPRVPKAIPASRRPGDFGSGQGARSEQAGGL